MIRTAEVGGVAVPVDHFIGGQWVGSDSTFESRSPLDWDAGVIANVARGDASTASAAVEAAIAGFDVWGSYSPSERAEVMHKICLLYTSPSPRDS